MQIDQLKQNAEELQAVLNGLIKNDSFLDFSAKAAKALEGIGAAAVLAAQHSASLSKIIDQASDSAAKAGSQLLTAQQHDNAAALKATDEFGQADIEIRSKYQSMQIDGAEQTAQEKQRILNSEFTMAKNGADALMTLADLVIENGKKNSELQKAEALVKIGIDTAKAISSLVAASNENPANAATSGIAGVVQFATGIVEIAANIAKAKDILDGGNVNASTAAPGINAAAPAINTNAPNLSATSRKEVTQIERTVSTNTSQQGMIKAYVVESEITSSQQRASSLRSQSLH